MPRYVYDPIDEAMCEFTFAPPVSSEQWDLTLPGRIQQHERLSKVYVGPSRQQNVQQIFAGVVPTPNAVPNFAVSTALLRVLLPTANAKALLGIGPNTLSISSLREYEGWDENFKVRIREALNAYYTIVHPTAITRIVLKYVNRIVAPATGGYQAANYLNDITPTLEATPENAPPITARLDAYQFRKEFTMGDQTKIYVTQATLQPADPANTSEFILDIEVVWDNTPTATADEAMTRIEQLHTIEGAVFEACITERARRLFNGTP